MRTTGQSIIRLLDAYKFIRARFRIWRYINSSRMPWSYGYNEYRWQFTKQLLASEDQLSAFDAGEQLPNKFGVGLDERIIEYPWLFQRLNQRNGGNLLDAGSVLNYDLILNQEVLKQKNIVIYTLASEGKQEKNNVSYIYGDLRKTILRDQLFDEIVCISTLEHIGMDNTKLYTDEVSYKENERQDYLIVVEELKRLLKPNGVLFLTIPFGRYENHGWFQQFDMSMVQNIISAFNGRSFHLTFYRYHLGEGWKVVSAEQAESASYNNIHNKQTYRENDIAASEAVVCIELHK